jgi:hypothetical protein
MLGRDEFSPARCAHTVYANAEAVGATSRSYPHDDRSMTSTMHNMRPTACIHALLHIIIMYALPALF